VEAVSTPTNKTTTDAIARLEKRVEVLQVALAAYRSALRSGEPETDQLRALGAEEHEWRAGLWRNTR
jgi:hypothetical protein